MSCSPLPKTHAHIATIPYLCVYFYFWVTHMHTYTYNLHMYVYMHRTHLPRKPAVPYWICSLLILGYISLAKAYTVLRLMDMLQELHELLTDCCNVAAIKLHWLCQLLNSCRCTFGFAVVFLLKVPLWNHRKATRVSASWMRQWRSRECHYPRSVDMHTNDVTIAQYNHAAGIFTLVARNIDNSSTKGEFI